MEKQRMLHGSDHDLFGKRDLSSLHARNASRRQWAVSEIGRGQICKLGVGSYGFALPTSLLAVAKTGGPKS